MVLRLGHWWGKDIIAVEWLFWVKRAVRSQFHRGKQGTGAGLGLSVLMILSAVSTALRLLAVGDRHEEMNVDLEWYFLDPHMIMWMCGLWFNVLCPR